MRRYFSFFYIKGFGVLVLMLFITSAQAAGLSDLEHQVRLFTAGQDAYFSPLSTSRAHDYLGAALLARSNHQAEMQQQAMAKVVSTLHEARSHAVDFRKRYAALLAQRTEARHALHYPSIRDQAGAASPTLMLNKGETSLSATIRADERGALNDASQSAKEAVKWYQQAIAAALPELVTMATETLDRARAGNAKYYTPVLYGEAKQELAAQQGFMNGSLSQLPAHPYHLLRVAADTLALTKQVKAWRKKRGSHEALVLAARAEHRALATLLGITVDSADPTKDVSQASLKKAIIGLQQQLVDERKTDAKAMVALRAETASTLKKQLAELRQQLTGTKRQQLTDLKAAFAAKLERETFDSRRQAGLRQLFAKGEAKIMINVDGSILLRLTGLHFHSGHSTVASGQLPLLGKVAKALALYKERNAHIEGHTDNRGDMKRNRALSLKRAESVRDVLITSGVAASRLKALGYGDIYPIASNGVKRGRAMNRRIDVVIQP
ncbi:MAG: OmpA family protein [Mariprofundales bacterium]|nr:OmpA family protein [Mariprofundales bacterium]